MTRIERVFGVDVRALAALRVALAALVLVDLALRAPDLRAFYTGEGVLPVELARSMAARGTWSVYFLTDSVALVALLFALHAAAATAMLLGRFTRLAAIVTWAMTVSLHGRNTLVLQGADDLMRVLLFWCALLPLGATWSLDARSVAPRGSRRPTSFATAGLLVQVATMYAVTGLQKTGIPWRDGSAIALALAHDHFGRAWAQAALLPHPDLLRTLTRVVLRVEWLAPAFLLAPFWTRDARTVACAVLLLLQVGFGVTLHVGHFPFVSVVALLPFLPQPVWDALERPIRPRATACRPELGVRGWTRRVTSAIAAPALAVVLAMGIARGVGAKVPDAGLVPFVETALGLDATWSMFAPEPADDSGWFVMKGALADGSVVDLFPALPRFAAPRPPSEDRPADVFAAFPGLRWLDYLMATKDEGRRDLWAGFADWTCRGWNARRANGERLESLEVDFLLERVTGEDRPRPLRRFDLFEGACP